MPELPEVETVMRGLDACLTGKRIRRAELARADLRFPAPPGLAAALQGRQVLGFRRRAKYFFMRLEGGTSLLVHLGMSGRFAIARPGQNDIPAHAHLNLVSEDGVTVRFVDPRRFGCLDLMPTGAEDAHRLIAGLGPEPLGPDFTAAGLAAALEGKQTPIKSALLDQRVVAGLGNIYVSEALFAAAISPRRLAGSVRGQRAARLAAAIQDVLRAAIAAGGSSLRDYVQPDGELGYFQHAWRVYGREGEPCGAALAGQGPGCGAGAACPGIRRMVQAGRSSFFCPRVQR